MGEVIPFELPASALELFKGLGVTDDLSAGVQPSFGVVSFKGKVWRVKYKGEEHVIKNRDGDPAASLMAVIVKGSPCISKIYYPGSYTEGDDTPPSCFSVDGVVPDPSSSNIQAQACGACPHNVWGSKVTEQGNKTKACADSRRLAIVPYPDVENEAFGGPLLLRVPPASLQNLAMFNEKLKAIGAPYQAVVVKIGFDSDKAYPHLTFTPVMAVEKEQAQIIIEMIHSNEVERMLASAPVIDGSDAPATPAQAVAKAKGAAPAPAPAPSTKKAAPTLVQNEVTPSDPEPEQEAPKEKPTAKEQNSVEADPVSAGIGALIDNFGL